MMNKGILIAGFCLGFSIVCLIWSCLWIVMAKDLCEKVSILEQEIIDYKWQLEQVDQMICSNEVINER